MTEASVLLFVVGAIALLLGAASLRFARKDRFLAVVAVSCFALVGLIALNRELLLGVLGVVGQA